MDVGAYIKQLRISKGLSQEELGKIVGVQRAAVQKWEAGKVQNLKRDTIKKLAEYFGVNPARFIDAEDTNKKSPEMVFTKQEWKLIEAYRTHPEAQAAINKLLDLDFNNVDTVIEDAAKTVNAIGTAVKRSACNKKQ